MKFTTSLFSKAIPPSFLRFLAGVSLILVSFFFQLKFGGVLGWRPDFVLVALVLLVFFYDFSSILFFIVLSLLLLSWPLALGPESLMLFFLPLLVFFLKDLIFPFEGWFSVFFAVVIVVPVFYFASVPHLFIHSGFYPLLFINILAAEVFATILFVVYGRYRKH